MKKSKEIKQLQNELLLNMENIDNIISEYMKKIKKEYAQIVIDEKNKLLVKISNGENLDLNTLKNKYLKSKEILSETKVSSSCIDNNEELLDKIVINDKIYYYENKEKGKVFNEDNHEVGIYKNSDIILY
jgi:hypothetical protein